MIASYSVVADPLYYNRHKLLFRRIYHAIIWLVAFLTCIPPLAAGAIGRHTAYRCNFIYAGLNEHGTCWFQGDFGWLAWAFDILFMIYAPGAILYLVGSLCMRENIETPVRSCMC